MFVKKCNLNKESFTKKMCGCEASGGTVHIQTIQKEPPFQILLKKFRESIGQELLKIFNFGFANYQHPKS